jgi:transposase
MRRKKKTGPKPKYPESFAKQVVRDIIKNDLSIREAARHYNVRSTTVVHGWYKKYSADIEQMMTTPMEVPQDNPTPATQKDATIKELQKALEMANLKITSLEIMIDIAEEELNVEIRKKSGTKQPEE